MRIKLLEQKDSQTLPEYCVGAASGNCTYPGIAQCFAIAGWTPAAMLCTHVSPGATKEEIEATFGHLRDLGGDNALRWYVVGPCVEHFAVVKAQWRSLEAIKGAFKKHLNNKTATRWILDVTQERQANSWGIDILAEPCGWAPVIYFSHKPFARNNAGWTDLKVHKFVRF